MNAGAFPYDVSIRDFWKLLRIHETTSILAEGDVVNIDLFIFDDLESTRSSGFFVTNRFRRSADAQTLLDRLLCNPRPLGTCGDIGGHRETLVQHLWATGGHRSRLLDLKARRSEVERITRGADPVVKIFGNPKNLIDFQSDSFIKPRLEAEQVTVATTSESL